MESRESNTAGETRRREVLLSGRGPLSSLSQWWQVSVAALATVDGCHRHQGTFLSQSPRRRSHCGASRALHEREECARRRRQATRTMRDPTPRVTPPPQSDATATRYAPGAERGPENRFRSVSSSRRDCEGIITPRGEPFRHSGTLFASSSWTRLLSWSLLNPRLFSKTRWFVSQNEGLLYNLIIFYTHGLALCMFIQKVLKLISNLIFKSFVKNW